MLLNKVGKVHAMSVTELMGTYFLDDVENNQPDVCGWIRLFNVV